MACSGLHDTELGRNWERDRLDDTEIADRTKMLHVYGLNLIRISFCMGEKLRPFTDKFVQVA